MVHMQMGVPFSGLILMISMIFLVDQWGDNSSPKKIKNKIKWGDNIWSSFENFDLLLKSVYIKIY